MIYFNAKILSQISKLNEKSIGKQKNANFLYKYKYFFLNKIQLPKAIKSLNISEILESYINNIDHEYCQNLAIEHLIHIDFGENITKV